MSIVENKAIVRRQRLEMYGQGKVELAEEIFASKVIAAFQSSDPMEVDPEFFRQNIIAWRNAFHDTNITIEHLIADGDEVAECWTWRGTHKGEFWGFPPTGKQAIVMGSGFYRIEDGKIVEVRGIWDANGLLEQLGFFSLPDE